MPAIVFPSSPTNGQQFTAMGITWEYSTTTNSWTLLPYWTGITNTAAANELMKSDGINAVPSGVFIQNIGKLVGINETTPTAQLVIRGAGGSGYTGGFRNTLYFKNSNSSGNQSNHILFGSLAGDAWGILNDLNADGTTVDKLSFFYNSSEKVRFNGSGFSTFYKPSINNYQTVALFGSTDGGLYVTTDNAILSRGAYYNAAWISTDTFGVKIDMADSAGGLKISGFTGATVPAAPTWKDYLVVNNGIVTLTNTTASSLSYFEAVEDLATSKFMRVHYLNSGFTTSGTNIAASGLIVVGSGGTGGLVLRTDANAPIIFATNGSANERVRITSSGITLASGHTLTGNLANTLTLAVSGSGLSGSATFNNSAASTFTVTSNATSSNTASTIVLRDTNGNFTAGTITAALSGNASTATQTTTSVTGTNGADLVYGNMADNDQFRIRIGGTATNEGFVEIATADDATEPIYVRQYTGVFTTLTRTATLLDGSGNTSFPGTLSSSKITPSYNSGVTGSTAPTYTQGNLELLTASNNVPAIGFHRGGYSATTLYEYDGQLYVNAWVSRAQTGLLLSSGNYNSYAPTLTGTGASGTWSIKIRGTDNTYANGLLQSGAGRADDATGDTWIFSDSLGSDSNKWGIKHNQPNDNIEFWGNNARRAYVELQTGHIYTNYVLASYLNASAGNSENPTIGQVWTQNTGDNYLRKSTPAHFISQLGLITSSSIGSQSVNYANYSGYLPPLYIGGQQLNPQTYFGQGVGLRVAMTASNFYWNDTLWINGYSGGDVKSMCALHTARNGEPRMWISSQLSDATSYGTQYEFVTSWNISSQSVNYANYSGNIAGTSGNLNTDRLPGRLQFFDQPGGTGAPNGDWHNYISTRHGNAGNQYGFQLANTFATENLYFRGWDGSNPYGWRTIIHSGNIGSQSVSSAGYASTIGINYNDNSGGDYQVLWGSGSGVYATGGVVINPSNAYIKASRFVDYNNESYYADPASTSYLKYIRFGDFAGTSDTILDGGGAGFIRVDYPGIVGGRMVLNNDGDLTIRGNLSAANVSDERFKNKISNIENALEKVLSLDGFYYTYNSLAEEHGYNNKDGIMIGLSAQQVQNVLPQITPIAAFDREYDWVNGTHSSRTGQNYLTIQYEKLVVLLVEAIKEQQIQIENLKAKVETLTNQ